MAEESKPPKNKYDIIFKDRLKINFLALLKNKFNKGFDSYQNITPSPVELPKTLERKADFVFLAEQNTKELVLHLEIQTVDDMDMVNRMFLYVALLNEQYKNIYENMSIKQIVLFLGEKSGAISKMPFEKAFTSFTYRYELINISEIDYKDFFGSKNTLIFAILGNFNGNTNVQVISEIVEESMLFFLQKEELAEFLTDLITLSILRKLEKEVRLYCNQLPKIMALNIDITEHPLYQEGELKGELKEKLAIATTMLLKGFTIFQVQDITELTFEQIKALQADLEKRK